MTTQGEEELEDYLKRSYLGALRSDGSGVTDASATIFADYVMTRIGGLLRDQERADRIANEQGLTKAILVERNTYELMRNQDKKKHELELTKARLDELEAVRDLPTTGTQRGYGQAVDHYLGQRIPLLRYTLTTQLEIGK